MPDWPVPAQEIHVMHKILHGIVLISLTLAGLVILLIILAIVCAPSYDDPSQTVPTQPPKATIHLTGAQVGTGLHPVMKKVNRACTFPGEIIKGPDGDTYWLEHGDEVEILEQNSACSWPKGGASKVRAVETGLVGWLATSELREK